MALVLLPLTSHADDEFSTIVQPFFKQHCIACHGPDKKKGGLRVDEVTADLNNLSNIDHWQNIADLLTTDEMPPEDEPRPDPKVVTEVIKVLTERVELAQEKHRSGGRPVRRLSQKEYINTVSDLLGVHIAATALPIDGSIGHFDTEAQSLYTTDMHLQTYLGTARDVIRRFIASRSEEPGQRGLRIRLSDAIKRPKYQFKVSQIKIPPAGHSIVRLICWQRDPSPENRIYIGDGGDRGTESYEVIGTPQNPQSIDFIFHEPGEQKLGYLEDLSNVPVTYPDVLDGKSDKEIKQYSKDRGKEVKKFKVKEDTFLEAQDLIKKVPVLVKKFQGIQVVNPQPYEFFKPFLTGGGALPDSAAEEIIQRFTLLISRGQAVDEALLENLNQIFIEGRALGEPFWEALVEPLAVSMCSIPFMFHFENREEGKESPKLSGVELANRISYFLWRSSPDAELLRLGRSNRLLEKPVFMAQVERLMRDKKFDRFLEDFIVQWLELDRQDMIAVDRRLYPDFRERSKHWLKAETIAFISELIREDLPLRNLIDSDFMMLNGMTAQFYGVPGVRGDAYRPVARRPEDKKRGGILTHAGILMQTGTGERSSIVERGVFVAKKLLNDHPPPPPANVAALPADNTDLVRMRAADMIADHRSNPQCASCHSKIDPLGLGLEEFDAIGLHRTFERRLNPETTDTQKRSNKDQFLDIELETRGNMPNGKTFKGVEGLKSALLKEEDLLAEAFIEALLSFANGRKAGAVDGNIVEKIQSFTSDKDYRARSVVKGVVYSLFVTSGKGDAIMAERFTPQ